MVLGKKARQKVCVFYVLESLKKFGTCGGHSPQPRGQYCTRHQPAPRHCPPGPAPSRKRTESCRTAERRSNTSPSCCTAGSCTPPSAADVCQVGIATDVFTKLCADASRQQFPGSEFEPVEAQRNLRLVGVEVITADAGYGLHVRVILL